VAQDTNNFSAKPASSGHSRHIAVVGAGVAGLGAAWLLQRQGHRVTLYERDGRFGGHANTVDVTLDGATAPVDTGFLVFNGKTYPNLIGLFGELGVESYETEMTFGVSADRGRLEWAGTNLGTVFAQPGNLFSPRFIGMIRDLLRFNRNADAHLAECAQTPERTLGQLLDAHGYGQPLRDLYLVPMAASIWSTRADEILDYPAATFLRFCQNHCLLQVNNRPVWRSVLNGSRSYVQRILAAVPDCRHGAAVEAVISREAGVDIVAGGQMEHFDDVVLAAHAPESLALLKAGTAHGSAMTEGDPLLQTLAAFRYQANDAFLHTDTALLPKRRKVWSAWNYIDQDGAGAAGGNAQGGVCVSYLLNRLQRLPFTTPLVVTLNPRVLPAPEKRIQHFVYEHPIFDAAAIRAQDALPGVQGRGHVWLAGAWTRYGFHEDGLLSAVRVAQQFGDLPGWARP
jgi:predicted NAD/FAD-binding protein